MNWRPGSSPAWWQVAGVGMVGQTCCGAGGAGGDEQVVALGAPVPLAGLPLRGSGPLGLLDLLPHRLSAAARHQPGRCPLSWTVP